MYLQRAQQWREKNQPSTVTLNNGNEKHRICVSCKIYHVCGRISRQQQDWKQRKNVSGKWSELSSIQETEEGRKLEIKCSTLRIKVNSTEVQDSLQLLHAWYMASAQ